MIDCFPPQGSPCSRFSVGRNHYAMRTPISRRNRKTRIGLFAARSLCIRLVVEYFIATYLNAFFYSPNTVSTDHRHTRRNARPC